MFHFAYGAQFWYTPGRVQVMYQFQVDFDTGERYREVIPEILFEQERKCIIFDVL